MLQFDEETTRLLDIAYTGAAITRRRQASFDALRPGPGDTILDIGCGNGLLTAELARAVGPGGRVIGIDPSADMRAAAEARCEAFDWATLVDGLADALPVDDGVADKAVSVQVFEYLDDMEAAAREARRCLRRGGRLVVGDMHFGTWFWHSDDRERMAAMRASWDRHFVNGLVPVDLPPILRRVGFEVRDVVPLTLSDHQLMPDGLAIMMMHLMRAYAVSNGHVDPEMADAWYAEQEALAAQGRFFFSMTHFVVVAEAV